MTPMKPEIILFLIKRAAIETQNKIALSICTCTPCRTYAKTMLTIPMFMHVHALKIEAANKKRLPGMPSAGRAAKLAG